MSASRTSKHEAGLRAWAEEAIERARAIWPQIAVSETEFVELAALRLSTRAGGGRALELNALDAAELYLAAACARGDDVALREFRVRYFDPLASSLRRMGLDAAHCDDVWQTLCERLFVAARDSAPKIVRYAGGGDLAGLVRVAATRVALNWLAQAKRRTGGASWLDRLPAAESDPELRAMKHEHRTAFKRELEAALATLTVRQRMVLRLHLVERMSIDSIATICSIHRATAARIIVRAKETLTGRIRQRLIAQWSVPEHSLPALMSVITSQLDLSLERLLAGD
jgi:RNA polymerase sigma-70 factor, ECF subfamily